MQLLARWGARGGNGGGEHSSHADLSQRAQSPVLCGCALRLCSTVKRAAALLITSLLVGADLSCGPAASMVAIR